MGLEICHILWIDLFFIGHTFVDVINLCQQFLLVYLWFVPLSNQLMFSLHGVPALELMISQQLSKSFPFQGVYSQC